MKRLEGLLGTEWLLEINRYGRDVEQTSKNMCFIANVLF